MMSQSQIIMRKIVEIEEAIKRTRKAAAMAPTVKLVDQYRKDIQSMERSQYDWQALLNEIEDA